MSQPQVVEIINELSENANLPKPIKTLADHAEPDFTPPIYNVWKWQEKTKGVKHFGNSELTILDNLLYLYTKPLDIIIDPFAGGGSSIEVCKKRLRRYWVSDRKPTIGREKDIRKWSIQEGTRPLIPHVSCKTFDHKRSRVKGVFNGGCPHPSPACLVFTYEGMTSSTTRPISSGIFPI